MMQFADIKMLKDDEIDGVQAVIDYGDYHLSIVKNKISYGGNNGLYEIGIFSVNDGVVSGMVELPGITNVGDTVKGYLTEDDINAILLKMILVTKKEPKQI